MRSAAMLAAAFLGCVAWSDRCRALEVTVDGTFEVSPIHHRAVWRGAIEAELPEFRLEGDGTATLIGGPSLKRVGPRESRNWKSEIQWISLVVLGDMIVHFPDDRPPMPAERLVFVVGERKLLIDGKAVR